ncbi:hypothetical protein EVAR_21869_1 [Eumeta japonica]|uniref:Uncharacterized protein n=1 Tax=Eumeta variegata TaxID=151549 RepID=A0A4C1VA74_EUMVA|nr:hypothetical protein EVAR_21869_1 [Eumeta japonica]
MCRIILCWCQIERRQVDSKKIVCDSDFCNKNATLCGDKQTQKRFYEAVFVSVCLPSPGGGVMVSRSSTGSGLCLAVVRIRATPDRPRISIASASLIQRWSPLAIDMRNHGGVAGGLPAASRIIDYLKEGGMGMMEGQWGDGRGSGPPLTWNQVSVAQ